MNTISSSLLNPALTSPLLDRQAEPTPAAVNDQAPQQTVPQAFEAMFASLLIKTLRQTGTGEGLFPGDSSDTLGALFDEYLGQHIAEAGGIGLTQALAAYGQRGMGEMTNDE